MDKFKEIMKARKFKYILFFCFLLATQFIVGSDLQYRNEFFSSTKQTCFSIIEIIILTIFITAIYYLLEALIKKMIKQARK